MTDEPTLLDSAAQAFRDHGLTAAITALIGGSLAVAASVTLSRLTGSDVQTDILLTSAREAIEISIADLKSRKEEQDREEEDHSQEWNYMASSAVPPTKVQSSNGESARRSIFDDVDFGS